MIEFTEKQLKRYKIQAQVITEGSDYYAGEILSKVLQNILKKQDDFELTDNYIFKSLRNTYLNMLKAEDVQNKGKMSLLYSNEDYITDIEQLKIEDKVKTDKLNAIVYVYDKVLNSFEKQLYYLHFVKGMSQREISRQTNIGLMSINSRINKIKTKIRKYYAENY